MIDNLHKENYLANAKEVKNPDTNFTLDHLKSFDTFFWIFVGYYSFVASTMFSMNGALTDFFVVKFNYPYEEAKDFIGLIQLIQIFLMPIFGALLQKFGQKPLAIVLCSLVACLALIWLLFLPSERNISVYPICWLLSFYISLYSAASYQCIPMFLADGAVSLGQGIGAAGQQLVLIVLPYLIGIYSEKRTPAAYQKCLYIWLANSIIGLFFALLVFKLDFFGDKLLTLKESDKRVKEIKERKNKKFLEISLKREFKKNYYKD